MNAELYARGPHTASQLLAAQDAVFRELGTDLAVRQREMQRVKTAQALAEEACVAFVRDMTDAYLRIAGSTQALLIEAGNQYLAGSIDEGAFARTIGAVSKDRGIPELGAEGTRLWERIRETVFGRSRRAAGASRGAAR